MIAENLPGFLFIMGCIVGLVAWTIVTETRKTSREFREAEEALDAHLATVTQINPARARSMANHPAGRGL